MADEMARKTGSLRAEAGHAAIVPSQAGGDLHQRLREALFAAHEELLARDEEFRAITGELIDLKDQAEADLSRREAEIAAERLHLDGLRQALEAWHARSEAEFDTSKQSLVAERDTARDRATNAEIRAHALESRFEHTLMIGPRRFAGRIKRWIGRNRTG